MTIGQLRELLATIPATDDNCKVVVRRVEDNTSWFEEAEAGRSNEQVYRTEGLQPCLVVD